MHGIGNITGIIILFGKNLRYFRGLVVNQTNQSRLCLPNFFFFQSPFYFSPYNQNRKTQIIYCQPLLLPVREVRIVTPARIASIVNTVQRTAVPAVFASNRIEHPEVVSWKKKVPYFINPKETGKLAFLPGLYSAAELPDKETGEAIKRHSFGLITRAATPLIWNNYNSGKAGDVCRYSCPLK